MNSKSVEYCSHALLKIGANAISSFEDGTIEAEVCANLYPLVRDFLLAAHPWNFAIRQQALPRIATTPAADFRFAYSLPSSCVRVLSAGANGRGRGLHYKIRGQNLVTDSVEAMLTYIHRPDEGAFPAFFVMALVAHLSAEFCIPLVESTSRWESMRKIADMEFRRARLIDSQEETPDRIEGFELVEGRH
jgi:hypothetical protein